MFRLFSIALTGATALLASGWLLLSEQTGTPLTPTEFAEQLGRLRDQVTDVPPPAVAATSQYANLEQAVHDQVNEYRAEQGLPPLTLDPRISEIARQHSADMAAGRVEFGHAGFESRVRSIARAVPYRSAAENVAYNQGYSTPVEQAVQGWIESPGHRVNMEGQFNLTGIGVTRTADGKYYFTQIFIRRLL
ncbi:CAP domain-containing protein [Microcoleus sp. FACHB-1515]|uniref:CAP domain-containing protein n=1 Tax=Cyanophyceae TaxID=3028117 RepID=UPI0016885D80|nr:CAP domain-containing protein [Microcoleus sp. FACHB-1515]MBD2092162.1 CAP domain-containing protein [Microcoleus sp. FACHB-1515]